MSDPTTSEQQPTPPSPPPTHTPPTQIKEDDLWREVLEAQAHKGDINLPYVVRMYSECVSERPLLRLAQDIEQRIGIYHNILEDIKKVRPDAPATAAKDLREKYEQLGLVPCKHLPNPLLAEMAAYALKKLRGYGDGLVRLMAEYAKEIKKELRISVNVKFNINVSVSLSPSVSFGVQDDTDD